MSSGNGTAGGGAQRSSFFSCSEVSAICPVKATTLGYYPNQGANIFFAAGFFLTGVYALAVGIWKKTWSYSNFLAAACLLETAGYGARAALSINPWNKDAFQTQIVAIILAPTLLCVSIYLTLKHVTLALSPSISRVPPRVYPLIFLPADVSCLLVQAIGGAIAASASNPPKVDLLRHGNRAIIAGVALQVVVLLFFGITWLDFTIRFKKALAAGAAEDVIDAEARALWTEKKFTWFFRAVAVAYAAVLIRCIYRIAEMAGGWGNHIMQDEPSFMVMDASMVLVASALLAFFAPGILFPRMAAAMNAPSARAQKRKQKKADKASGGTTPNESQDVEAGTGAAVVEKQAAPNKPENGNEPKVLVEPPTPK